MKRYYKALLTVVALITTTAACKLDDSIVPAIPPPVVNTASVQGITINSQFIDDSYLTASWKTTSTTQQYYDTSNVVLYGIGVANKFGGVSVNDQIKNYKYTDLASTTDVAEGHYELATTNNVLYIKMAANPFFLPELKSQIRITNLTSTNMTWVAVDTNIVQYNSKPARLAYQVTFTKQP